MTSYVGRVISALSSALDFNSATLSGAIDIIVIEDERGTRKSSPFHVRFGKFQLLKAGGCPVSVELNGRPTHLSLFLAPAGEAYFYAPPAGAATADAATAATATATATANTPEKEAEFVRQVSAPLPEEYDEGLDAPFLAKAMGARSSPNISVPVRSQGSGYVSDSEVEVSRCEREGRNEVVDEPRSPPVGMVERGINREYRRSWALRREVHDENKDAMVRDGVDIDDGKEGGGANGGEDAVEKKSVDIEPVSLSSGSSSSPPVRNEVVTLSPDAETLAVAAEDAKLEMRSLDGYEDGDSPILNGRIGGGGSDEECLDDAIRLPLQRPHSAHGPPRPEDLSRALADALGKARTFSSPEIALARREMARSVTMDESEMKRVGQEGSALVMSRCGHLVNADMEEEQIYELVVKHRVQYRNFAADPNLLFDPDMLFCIDDRLVEFRIVAPFVMSSLAFGVPLDIDLLSSQMNAAPVSWSLGGSKAASGESQSSCNGSGKEGPVAASTAVASDGKEKRAEAIKSGGRFRWFGWSKGEDSSPAPVGEPLFSEEDLQSLDATPTDSANRTPLPGDSNSEGHVAEHFWEITSSGGVPPPPRQRGRPAKPQDSIEKFGDEHLDDRPDDSSRALFKSVDGRDGESFDALKQDGGSAVPSKGVGGGESGSHDSITAAIAVEALAHTAVEQVVDALKHPPALGNTTSGDDAMLMPDARNLSLEPTAEQLADLDLKPGANTIRFIVEASAAEVECRIFLWGPDVKIVISDVDGTITRSDVLGHVLPAVGRDWSHVGVAGLYSEIAKHGYKFMYLTARPIGMASTTRDFLHGVVQGGSRLPNGPVLMSPNRLVESFTREVIRRKPQEFKIACLREIRSLFTMDYNPFHAGFGNRDTDVISYRAVGLIPHRIFVVNTAAELVVNSVRFESAASYNSLRVLVNSVFPDIDGKVGREHVLHITDQASFNSWNFWKPELPDIDLEALLANN